MSDTVTVSADFLTSLLFDWLKLDEGTGIDRATATAFLDAASQLANDHFLPSYRAADIDEPRLGPEGVEVHPAIHAALEHYAELGFFGASFPDDLGGLGLPQALASAMFSIFASANTSASSYAMLTGGNARLIATFGSPAQIDEFARPQIAGRWFGTMCLSEPQAGSSLGDIRTRARKEGDDDLGARYRLYGNKMWISGGDQDVSENIVHLVLAKVEGADGKLPAGSKGISLFIVPKCLGDGTKNDLAVAGLNHKLGNRGTSNCLLNFGETDGAIGWLVGEEGQGLAQMFQMMNEARISVGMGAAALAYRGYRHSVRYARERSQGRALGNRDGEPIAIAEHPDVRRMLLQQKAYSEAAIALCLYCNRLADDRSPEAEDLLALLTPIAKSWPSEFGPIANDLAIQVHGGYGYTRDFDVEQLWRDNRLNMIHEGTHGIQAIDLLRRKILLSDGSALAILAARMASTFDAASQDVMLAPAAAGARAYWDEVHAVIDQLRSSDAPHKFNDATMFLRAFGHGIVAWLWIDLALAARGSVREEGARATANFFIEAELPQAKAWLGIVGQLSPLAGSVPDLVFA